MKKHIIALAVAAAVAAPAAAMADTTLYGKIHASYDFWGGDNGTNQDYSLSSNSSRIGIKGSEKISDALSVVYQYETTVDWGGKASGGTGGLGGERNTFIGFTGGWGTAIAGRHDTPMKMVGRKYDLFGDTVGDSRNLISGPDGMWDLRTGNTVAYVTPNLAGFHAALAYVSDWGTGAATLNNKFNAYSVSAGYSIAGFMIDGAYEKHQTAAVAAPFVDNQDAYRIGAGYKIAGFKIVGLYQKIKNVALIDGADVSTYGVGGSYTFGASTVKAQYYKADNVDNTTNTGSKLWAVGYDYKISKQTSAYAMYAKNSNDGTGAGLYAIGYGGHGERPTFTGPDSSAFSVGLIHKF